MFNTDSTLRPSKMGPQAPAANFKPPPSATVTTARVQVQTNKFFSLEIPDLAKSKKSQPSKRNKEDDEDDLPFLVGEKVRTKASNGAGAGAPSTLLSKAPTVGTAAGEVTVEDADDEEDVKSKPVPFPSSLLTKYLCTTDLEAKKKGKRRKRLKQKEQVQKSTTSPNGRRTSSSMQQTSPTRSVQPPSLINLSTFSGSCISIPNSLAQPAPTIAQSARAYLASKTGLDAEPKGKKTKTRADPCTSPSFEQPPPKEEKKKKRFFSHFTRKNKEGGKDKENEEDRGDGETEKEKEGVEKEKKGGKFRVGLKPRLNLPPKAASLIGRLLGGKADEKKGQAGMKWEHFVKVCHGIAFLVSSRSILSLSCVRLTLN
jgi:hypothetical protein